MFLSNKNLDRIIKKKNSGTKLSIYIPTHPASTSPTLTEDIIRLKNAFQIIKAHKQFDKRELGETMGKLESLLEDQSFWKHRTLGLAVFADKEGYETIDLNYEITDMQYVADTYVVSPLAIMLSLGTGYFVLNINHTKPRLVYFSSSAKDEIDLKDMPGSLEQTIDRDEHPQRLQHQNAPVNMFHGQSESGAIDADTLLYYKLIAKAVDDYLVEHDEPLLLTGTENRIGHLRPLLEYSNVLQESVVGNNEDLNVQELQDATISVIKSADTVNRDNLITKVKATPPSSLAIGTAEIETAIAAGRVEALYFSTFQKTTDNVREGENEIIVLQLPGNIKATESLVRGALTQGSKIVAVKQGSFKTNEPIALCRF